MSSALFHVRVHALDGREVDLDCVSSGASALDDLCTSRVFAWLALCDASPSSPLRAALRRLGDTPTDPAWARTHVGTFVESTRLMSRRGHGYVLRVRVTEERWLAHLRVGLEFDTTAYDVLPDAAGSAHRGVGVIVTNPARDRFLVQRKDASYPRFPRGYSLFGGAREPGESDVDALARELEEELGAASAQQLVAAGLREIEEFVVGEPGFAFVLFEAVVEDALLDVLAARPVFEGECAQAVTRGELAMLPWVWSLAQVIATYLGRRDAPFGG
jgi:8-oxo-dGTP pyrophosphatase MutT (NUDIX family)